VLGVKEYLYLLYFAMAGMFIISNLIVLFGYFPGRLIKSGGQLAHFGFGIMLIGILGSSAYTAEKRLVLPRGESAEVFGVRISYQGMEHDVNYPKNKLLLSYDDGSGPKDARPQLYFSKRTDGLMRKPFILKTFLQDVYFSPEQVQAIPGSSGLAIAKGEKVNVGDYQFTFEGYEIGNHASKSNNMAVTARISIESENEQVVVQPSRVMQQGEDGQMEYVDFPATFGENDEYSVVIEQILADKHAVVIDVPGIIEKGPEDQLIMSVSKKPIIMLVWIGTTLIMLGSAVVCIRRYREQFT
jgi:cytochrome c-type biogenesis protein CcmF